jgi:hypothetical protein
MPPQLHLHDAHRCQRKERVGGTGVAPGYQGRCLNDDLTCQSRVRARLDSALTVDVAESAGLCLLGVVETSSPVDSDVTLVP